MCEHLLKTFEGEREKLGKAKRDIASQYQNTYGNIQQLKAWLLAMTSGLGISLLH